MNLGTVHGLADWPQFRAVCKAGNSLGCRPYRSQRNAEDGGEAFLDLSWTDISTHQRSPQRIHSPGSGFLASKKGAKHKRQAEEPRASVGLDTVQYLLRIKTLEQNQWYIRPEASEGGKTSPCRRHRKGHSRGLLRF